MKKQANVQRHTEPADQNLRLKSHGNLFYLLAVAAGLIFLQGYMIAPLIPRLSEIFGVSVQEIGFIVPIYMLSYAVMALFLWHSLGSFWSLGNYSSCTDYFCNLYRVNSDIPKSVPISYLATINGHWGQWHYSNDLCSNWRSVSL